jgi:DNA-binding transcriptional ArsR family regulator
MDAIFKALGDPVRLAVVDELAQRDAQTLFEIVVRLVTNHGFSLSRQAVSKHLAVLEAAGILQIDRVGRTTVHRLNTEALASARAWLSQRTDTP